MDAIALCSGDHTNCQIISSCLCFTVLHLHLLSPWKIFLCEFECGTHSVCHSFFLAPVRPFLFPPWHKFGARALLLKEAAGRARSGGRRKDREADLKLSLSPILPSPPPPFRALAFSLSLTKYRCARSGLSLPSLRCRHCHVMSGVCLRLDPREGGHFL